jgi:hypothetical protein
MYSTTYWENLMNLRNIPLILLCPGLITIAFAEGEPTTQMVISIDDESGDGGIQLNFGSDDLGFNLHDMQEGENRSFIDKSGRSILITREADGLRFDVDGKTINMPFFDGEHHGAMLAGFGDHENINMHVIHDASMAGMRTVSGVEAVQGVTIVSEKTIDDATQQEIKSLLESAGYGDEVLFLGAGDGPDGIHGVRVIKKTVEVTN